MATDSEHSTALGLSMPVPLRQAQDSCQNPPILPEQERAMVIPIAPKRTRNGVGRIVSRTRAVPQPIVEFDVE
jgi:hypothetical protein